MERSEPLKNYPTSALEHAYQFVCACCYSGSLSIAFSPIAKLHFGAAIAALEAALTARPALERTIFFEGENLDEIMNAHADDTTT